jgi:hypothetical protein
MLDCMSFASTLAHLNGRTKVTGVGSFGLECTVEVVLTAVQKDVQLAHDLRRNFFSVPWVDE